MNGERESIVIQILFDMFYVLILRTELKINFSTPALLWILDVRALILLLNCPMLVELRWDFPSSKASDVVFGE